VLVPEEKQQGNTFGERYLNAIEAVFEQGYDHIITIGNDTPQLTTAHLKQATAQLANQSVVLGPSADGGYYLMGMHRSQYNRAKFEALPWQQASLLRSITHLFEEQSVYFLNKLRDVDRFHDVRNFLHSFKGLSATFKKILIALYGTAKAAFYYSFLVTSEYFFRKPLNKGSPVSSYNRL
tara:strand:- start:3660 stop:4199 length:540 start_codon:yes stop_codon:yes gene_type:complete